MVLKTLGSDVKYVVIHSQWTKHARPPVWLCKGWRMNRKEKESLNREGRGSESNKRRGRKVDKEGEEERRRHIFGLIIRRAGILASASFRDGILQKPPVSRKVLKK